MGNPFAGMNALVTGASAGLGEEFARQLARRGVKRIALVARRADRLEQLRAELSCAALQVDVLPCDLGNEEAVTHLMNDLDAAGFSTDILINNAGFGDMGNLETADPAKIESMLAVNVVALTRLVRWAIPGMIERRRGWICNVGSAAGMLPLPTFAVYAATKAYVNSFSEGLRLELRRTGVKVLALCPGPIQTEFGKVASRPNGKREFSSPAMMEVPKEKVVAQTLDGLAAGRARLIPGLGVHLPILLTESTPRCLLRGFFNLMSGRFRPEAQ